MLYFLFPLQLDSDSQVRRYSPFSGMKEAIAHVLTSFAHSAPKSMHLLIRNHPLDNGLINYRRYIRQFSHACGLEGRVHFVWSRAGPRFMMDAAKGWWSSTARSAFPGFSGVYPSIALARPFMRCAGWLRRRKSRIWTILEQPAEAVPETLRHFEKVLKCRTLINGNFYTEEGVRLAIQGVMERIA